MVRRISSAMTQIGIIMEHIMAPGGWKSSAMAKRYARVNPVGMFLRRAAHHGCGDAFSNMMESGWGWG